MSELRIERIYPIEPAALFSYLTQPNKLTRWWGPEGATIKQADLDLTKPGPWSVTFDTSRGVFHMHGEVIAVRPETSVEFTMNVPGRDGPGSTVRFEVSPEGNGGSRLTLIQTGITDEMVEMGKRGWAATLARLEHMMGQPEGT